MNLNKARDFYSDHYEGTLDSGLRQAFERAMASDPHIEADYREFCSAMGQLNAFGQDEIEIPTQLHETISARLDRHIYEAARTAKKPGFLSWRLPLYGAVAATAIFGAFLAVNRPSGPGASVAGFVPTQATKASTPELSVKDGKVNLSLSGRHDHTVTVRDEASGKILHEIKGGTADVSSPITNEREEPVVVLIEFSDKSETMRIVIPGTRSNSVLTGEGKLADLGMAIAETYRVPVLLPAETGSNVAWEFKATDTVETLPDALSPAKVLVETRSNGFLALSR